jgi:hypothetical protein
MIQQNLDTVLSYYLLPGVMSDPGAYTAQFQALPAQLPELVRTLQGLVLHIFWAERYGVPLSEERKGEVSIRAVPPKIDRLLAIDPRPLDQPRPPELRLVGNCRDFSLLLASMLKAHGIPARARCGFGTYFMPNHFEDHWMTEVWDAAGQRWVQVDSQLDALQQQALKISFSPLDMPPGEFVLAGQAWQMCRQAKANPDQFGIFQWHGWDFIKGNVLRDFLSLNNVEVLPWDGWGLTEIPYAEFTPEQRDLLDHIADLTLAGNAAFDALRALYESDPIFHFPV